MMTAVVDTPGTMTVEDRLDALSEQLAFVTAELREQQKIRESAQGLVHDLAPVSVAVMNKLTTEFAGLEGEFCVDDAARLARTLARNTSRLEALLAQLDSITQLAEIASHLSGPAMAMATERLQQLDEKGYFTFARQGAAIADRVVTSFDEDDVAALGENVVLILETVKEMTQPEVMTMLRRTATSAQHMDETFAEPPSTFALLKQMRDPEVRRGLARAMNLLRTLGVEPTETTTESTKKG